MARSHAVLFSRVAGLLAIASILIVMTILFEGIKDGLRDYVRKEYLPIVDHMCVDAALALALGFTSQTHSQTSLAL